MFGHSSAATNRDKCPTLVVAITKSGSPNANAFPARMISLDRHPPDGGFPRKSFLQIRGKFQCQCHGISVGRAVTHSIP